MKPSIKELFDALCIKLNQQPETGLLVLGLYIHNSEHLYYKNCTIIFNKTLFKDRTDTEGIVICRGKLIPWDENSSKLSQNKELSQIEDMSLIIGEDPKHNRKIVLVSNNGKLHSVFLEEDEENMIIDIILNHCIILGKLPGVIIQ